MKRPIRWNDQVDAILSDEEANDDGSGSKQSNDTMAIDQHVKENISEVTRRAQMYQEYMKQLPIPTHRGSLVPFTSWTGLATSLKLLYGQPLHYLTNIHLKQLDKMRIGSEDEDKPLDITIHPCKAEVSIWLIEEVHRLTTSHHHLANLWLTDPIPHAYIDPIFPKL